MKYKFTMPTPERCKELAIKREGLYTRMQLWLMGITAALSWVTSYRSNISFPNANTIVVEINSSTVINNITDRLEDYGFTREEVKPLTATQKDLQAFAGFIG